MGARLLAVRPTFAEQVTGRVRQAQPIYPKDLGAILVGADIHPGARVLEAGTGGGALTLALVRAVGPDGLVVSYEQREDFLEAAKRAIGETLGGLPPNLELKLGDVYTGVEERDMDRVLLDLPEPWQAVGGAKAALRPGGSSSPTSRTGARCRGSSSACPRGGDSGWLKRSRVSSAAGPVPAGARGPPT